MKKIILFLFCLLALMVSELRAEMFSQFNRPDFKIGTWRGSSFEETTKSKLPQATLIYFKDSNDNLIEALRNDKIDAFMADRITAEDLIRTNPDLTILNDVIDTAQYAMAFRLDNHALRDEFAQEIKKMKADGRLNELHQQWLNGDGAQRLSTVAPKGTRGLLRVGTSAVDPPFSFYLNNKLVGAEIELVNEIARSLDYTVEWSVVDHSSFIRALQENTIDIDASLLTITPQRQTQVLFGEPDYEDTVVFVVKKQKGTKNGN